MNEADEEHHVAKLLIAELDAMDGSESHFDAKFQVLAENVRHHIKEEEDEMLPKAQGVKVDFEALAEKMSAARRGCSRTASRRSARRRMVRASRGKGDSPAQAAKRKARSCRSDGPEGVVPAAGQRECQAEAARRAG